jgi:hypothetical protein
MTKLIVSFCSFANAAKNRMLPDVTFSKLRKRDSFHFMMWRGEFKILYVSVRLSVQDLELVDENTVCDACRDWAAKFSELLLQVVKIYEFISQYLG